MIFNGLCAIATNKILKERKGNVNSYPYVKDVSITSSNAEKFELINELKPTAIYKITSEDIPELKDSTYNVPVFYKGKFINMVGNSYSYNLFNNDINDMEINCINISEGIKIIGPYVLNYGSTIHYPKNLKEVILPSTIEVLMDNAFYGVYNKPFSWNIDISNLGNCWYFGKECLRYATNIKGEFDFKDNLNFYLGVGAFSYSNFAGINGTIAIPKSLTSIPNYCFRNTEKLKHLILHDNITNIGNAAFYESFIGEGDTLVLPKNLTALDIGSFYHTKYSDVVLNENLEEIGDTAFCFDSSYNFFADKLTGTYKVPDKIRVLGDYWYANKEIEENIRPYYLSASYLNKLKKYQNDCVLDLTDNSNLEILGAYCFAGFHKIKGSLFPPKIKEIRKNAYAKAINFSKANSTDLIEVTHYNNLPDTLEVLGDDWYNAYSIPLTFDNLCMENSSLKKLGNYAFNLKHIYSETDSKANVLYSNCTLLCSSIVLPSTLETIGTYCFAGQPNLEEVTFLGSNELKYISSDGRSYIVTSIFQDCPKLKKIDTGDKQISNICEFFAANCSSLIDFTYNATISVIYECAFYNTSLKSFDFKEGLTQIRGCSFASNNPMLFNQEIVFPSTLEYIYPQAFHTANMKSIVFNEGLKEIHYDAFEKCTNVTNELVFPSTLEYIGSFAFDHYQNCSNTSITIPASVRIIGEGGDPTHTAYREYNSGSHNFYNCASKYNKEFIVEEGNNWFTAIDGVLFGKDSDGNVIRLISMPRQLAKKENSPIINGTYIIPEGVTILDELCFNYCVGVTELVLPNSYIINSELPKSTKKLYGDTYYYALNKYTSYINQDANTLSVAIYTWHTLQNVTCKEDNPNYKSINGLVYSKDGKSLWYLSDCKTGAITIADGTERIEHGALFVQSKTRIKATSLYIPASVTYIDTECVKELNNYYIPSGVCTVTIDSANTSYVIVDNKVTKL